YGASIIGLHHPQTFAAIQSWSGYFGPTDPSGTTSRSVGSAAANAKAKVATFVPRLRAQFETYPTSFAFHVGNSDPTFVLANVTLQRQLATRESRISSASTPEGTRRISGSHTQRPGW